MHQNALAFYRFFIDKKCVLTCSTISVAEYCVGGNFDELPWKDLQVLPFNINHAQRAGELAKLVFQHKNQLNLSHRNVIPNDTKLFAQADAESKIDAFATSDEECISVFNMIQTYQPVQFSILNIRKPFSETFGLLFAP
ncbi:MAG: hypothetical protein ACKVU0_19990 [Saprospiraceae bacterium]